MKALHFLQPSLEVTGVRYRQPAVSDAPSGAHTFVVTVRVGPANSSGDAITARIGEIAVLAKTPRGAGTVTTVDGPWAFRFAPDEAAAR